MGISPEGTDIGVREMADEALAGLDEGALRKLVSGPVIPTEDRRARLERPGLSVDLSADMR